MIPQHNSTPPASILKPAGKVRQVLISIGEEAFELGVSLLTMIMVERTYGQQGLGIYAYLTACLYTVRYAADFGVARYTERQTARMAEPGSQQRLIHQSTQATLITGMVGAAVLLATAGFDTSHTRVQERFFAYVIMALILPAANLNRLKLSILHGRGAHQQVANVRMQRHGLILVGTFLLCGAGVAPSYLLIAVLIADGFTAVQLRRYLILPPIRDLLRQMRRILVTLRQSRVYLFADNALDMLLNIDLFVLGLFVNAWDLGIYAEAAVLVRFFLIVPVGIKPILRRRYIQVTDPKGTQTMDYLVRRHASILFSLHAVLALVVILNFPAVLDLFFETHGETRQALNLFQVFLPGLIFFGPWTALEPVYEAFNRIQRLKRLTLFVSAVNLILTFYLVPAAGVAGAAAATMLTMLIYFLLFGRRLGMKHQVDKFTYLAAGMGLYLIYAALSWLSWPGAVTILLGPLLAVLLFYACGVFQPVSISIERRHPS